MTNIAIPDNVENENWHKTKQKKDIKKQIQQSYDPLMSQILKKCFVRGGWNDVIMNGSIQINHYFFSKEQDFFI